MTNFTVCHNWLSMKIHPHVFVATPPVPWVPTNQQFSKVGWTKTCFFGLSFSSQSWELEKVNLDPDKCILSLSSFSSLSFLCLPENAAQLQEIYLINLIWSTFPFQLLSNDQTVKILRSWGRVVLLPKASLHEHNCGGVTVHERDDRHNKHEQPADNEQSDGHADFAEHEQRPRPEHEQLEQPDHKHGQHGHSQQQREEEKEEKFERAPWLVLGQKLCRQTFHGEVQNIGYKKRSRFNHPFSGSWKSTRIC